MNPSHCCTQTVARADRTQQSGSVHRARLPVIFFVLCFGLSFIVYCAKWDLFRLGSFMDDANYAVLAQSFVYSHQYGLVNSPGEPIPTRYPFGFPLLLSPLACFYPNHPEILKTIALGATLINSLLIFFGWPWLCPKQSYWRALSISAFYAFSPLSCLYTRMVMSEPVFLMYTLVALILAEQLSGISRNFRWWCFGLGIVGIYLYFLRSIGIIAIGVLGIRLCGGGYSISIKKISYLIFGAIFTATLIIVLTPVSISDFIPREYLQQFTQPELFGSAATSNSIERILPNAKAYWTLYLARLIPVPGESSIAKYFDTTIPAPYGGLWLVSLLIAGFVSLWKQKCLAFSIVLFTIFYCGVLLVWPWASERFLYPIFPFLLMFYVEGIYCSIAWLCRCIRCSRPLSRGVATGLTSLFAASVILVSIDQVLDDTGSLNCTPDFTTGPRWLLQHSQPSKVIMAELPQIVFLYSHHKTVQNDWYYETPNQLIEALRRDHIDYLLIAPELKWNCSGKLEIEPFVLNSLLPMLETLVSSNQMKMVFAQSQEQVRIYEVVKR